MTVRLLFLMRDFLPPARADVAVLFGKELRGLGVQSDLLGQRHRRWDSPLADTWPAGAMHIRGVERPGMLGDLLRTWYDLAAFRLLARSHHIVQVRDKIRAGALGLLLARLSRRPFVYWMSFPIVEGLAARSRQVAGSQGWVVRVANATRAALARVCFYKLVAPRADHLFVQSDAMLEFMAAKGIPRSRMTAVPMCVDAALLTPLAPAPRHPRLQGRAVITYLGALSQARQSDFLLEVVARARESVPNVLLLLAGDAVSADEQSWIRQRIEQLGVSDVVWLTGWLSQPEALALVRQANVGLSPIPRGELFDVSSPTKAVEYLALGLPCVCNDIPDQAQVMSASGAGVCVPMEVAAFSQAAIELLQQPQHAAAIGSQGPGWVAQHRTYPVVARRVAQVYQQLTQGRNSSREQA